MFCQKCEMCMLNYVVVFLAGVLFFNYSVRASDISMKESTQTFSVKLGKSRIIYIFGSKGYALPVHNEQNYPMLVQTKITADKELGEDTTARFHVSPPLFRLDGNQSAKLRITHTGGDVATDRESLFWVCVKGIAPKQDDSWVDDKLADSPILNVQMMVSNCIKLLGRPKSLVGQDALTMAERLSWRQAGNDLTAVNPTPFYINLSTLSVGGVAVDNVRHIEPFSSHTFSMPAGAKGAVQWRALSDLGGEGPLLTSPLN